MEKNTMRIALGVEYDGSALHGWQKQQNLRTAQGLLEQALSKIADTPIQLHCAGRTDTGVHATGQVVHFDTDAERDNGAWLFGTNSNLAKDVGVRWVKPISDKFHARFSATGRWYRYIISNSHVRPALFRNNVSWCYRPLDIKLMQEGARYLVGKHDFSAFRTVECQAKSPIRTIYSIHLQRKDDLIIMDIKANSFLHHMVRNIAGVLMAIGMARKPADWADFVLKQKDRNLGGVTAPPYGLYLVGVRYPKEFELPNVATGPEFIQFNSPRDRNL